MEVLEEVLGSPLINEILLNRSKILIPKQVTVSHFS